MGDSIVKSDIHSTGASSRGRPREFDIDEVLEAAMELFWKQGYMQSSLSDLCAAMDIRPPSFYRAFGTRENLFLKTARFYVDKYWGSIQREFSEESDVREAFANLFKNATKMYMRPGLPKGCFIDVSTVGLGSEEARIKDALAAIDEESREVFRKRLLRAIEDGQIPPETDVPAICGAVMAFLKGLSSLARGNVCQSELAAIASRGSLLLPPATIEG